MKVDRFDENSSILWKFIIVMKYDFGWNYQKDGNSWLRKKIFDVIIATYWEVFDVMKIWPVIDWIKIHQSEEDLCCQIWIWDLLFIPMNFAL